MATPPATQLLKDAETRVKEGDFLQAINLYEEALDGSPGSAEIHYRLGLLYDDKMHDPLNALHHFKRCLTIAPGGKRGEEVKMLMKHAEVALVSDLSGDLVVSKAEAVRLKKENADLRQQLEEIRGAAHASAAAPKPSARPRHEKKPVKRSSHR